MNKLLASLTLPDGQSINTNIAGSKASFTDLASFVSGVINIIIYLSAFLAFYYLVWGSFQYILAEGNKEGLAKAKERIRWALVGLLVVFMAYFIAKFGQELFLPDKGGLPF